jgi:hypothetical protein
MYGVDAFVDTDVFDAYSDAFRRAPGFMGVQSKRLIQRRKSQLITEVFVEPPLPDLPFVWSLDPAKNARARRWYFANKVPYGSEGGRYPRTGDLLDGFDILVNVDEGTGVFTITNDVPGAEFVIGFKQVPSHHRWVNIDDAALRMSELLNDDFINLWAIVNDPYAGV